MTTSRETGWDEAIMEVLRDTEEPMAASDITRLIGEGNLRPLTGAKPVNTVHGRLSSLASQGKVSKTSRGLYALPETAQRSEAVEAAETAAAEAAAADPQKLTVKAYGLYWNRSLTDWDPTHGQVLGRQASGGGTPINFADQDGIYLLHSGTEIVYVGQSYTPGTASTGLYSRLQSHHKDHRKTDRWDTFSWFGFRPVDDATFQLLPTPDSTTARDAINMLEAILIEGLMPRLNMRAGEDTKDWLKSNQYFQVEDPALIAKRLSALATVGQALR